MKFKNRIKQILLQISALPWRKIIRNMLFPKTAVLLAIVPLAALFLIYMLINGDGGAFSIISYVFSFYALVVVSLRVPDIVVFVKKVKNENKYLEVYFSDPELRVRISLYLSLVINIAYAVFQVGLGLVHSSLWYYSLGGYYMVLSLLRFFIVRYDRKPESQRLLNRWVLCRLVGILLLVMTFVLSGVILHMITLDIIIIHHQITTIAMAAYTFTALTVAIVGIVRRRKNQSLVFMVSKAISLVSALVSIITLENAMISAFGGEDMAGLLKLMTALTGAAVCTSVVAIAVFIIVISNNESKNQQKALNPEQN